LAALAAEAPAALAAINTARAAARVAAGRGARPGQWFRGAETAGFSRIGPSDAVSRRSFAACTFALNTSIPASMHFFAPRISASISSASLPQHVTGRNYVIALSGGGLVQYLLNSIVAAGGRPSSRCCWIFDPGRQTVPVVTGVAVRPSTRRRRAAGRSSSGICVRLPT